MADIFDKLKSSTPDTSDFESSEKVTPINSKSPAGITDDTKSSEFSLAPQGTESTITSDKEVDTAIDTTSSEDIDFDALSAESSTANKSRQATDPPDAKTTSLRAGNRLFNIYRNQVLGEPDESEPEPARLIRDIALALRWYHQDTTNSKDVSYIDMAQAETSETYASEDSSPISKANGMHYKAKCFHAAKEFERAEANFLAAIKLIEIELDPNSIELISMYESLCNFYLSVDDLQKYEASLSSLRQLKEKHQK